MGIVAQSWVRYVCMSTVNLHLVGLAKVYKQIKICQAFSGQFLTLPAPGSHQSVTRVSCNHVHLVIILILYNNSAVTISKHSNYIFGENGVIVPNDIIV